MGVIAMKGIAVENRIHCENEHTDLSQVVVVKPSFMKIDEVINGTQKHYKDSNIDVPLALQQHEAFLQVLCEQKVEVVELPADPSLPEQVFTRDIAFAIHDQVFVASMSEPIRKAETDRLKTWLQENSIPYQEGLPGSIEGGDVIVDGSTLWVGRSGRTSDSAIKELENRLPSYTIQPLDLQEDILHLDCVFNVISRHTALVYPPAFTPEDLRSIQTRFEVIPVSKKEQFQMGPNVLSIGRGKVISLSMNKRLNQLMEYKGFEVIPVHFTEIIKSGGSFRCCTMPLQRN